MHILLATDGSANGNASADLLCSFKPETGTTVTVLSVTPGYPLLGADLKAPAGIEVENDDDIARAIVDQITRRLESAGYEAKPVVRAGNPVDEILDQANDEKPDAILLGIQGVGRLRRLLVGSVASTVARKALAPVLLLRNPPSLSIALIATDGSPGSERAITTFLRMPKSMVNRAILLRVTSSDDEGTHEDRSFGRAASALQASGISVVDQTAQGNEVEEILRVAEDEKVTVIVLGASSKRVNGESLLGTTANGVLNRAPCSILIGR